MEVRVRALADQQSKEEFWIDHKMEKKDLSSPKKPHLVRRVKHEINEMTRVTCNVLRCQASKLSYLFIPAFISIFWLVICLITTRNPNVTLEDRYIKVNDF